MQFLSKKLHLIIFILIFSLAAFFRLYGIDWDQGQHLHPDERFLTMVATGISWPKNIFEYLNASTSPMNPHNRGFGFFVYGTFPVFFTKWVAQSLGKGDYGNLALIGRQLSAYFDLGTVVLVFLIGKQITTNQLINKSTNKQIKRTNISILDNLFIGNWFIGLFAAFIYAASVLPIQLSHFYAVDTYLVFFITLSLYLLIKILNTNISTTYNTQFYKLNILLGISLGLAFACKITAVFFAPVVLIGFISYFIRTRNFMRVFLSLLLMLGFTYFTIRLAQPYMFAQPSFFTWTLNPAVLENWKQLKALGGPDSGFPPAIQWIKTKPYLFPLKNTVLWGLGLPIGIISLSAILYFLMEFILKTFKYFRKTKKQNLSAVIKFMAHVFKNSNLTIIVMLIMWILIVFGYEGMQFAKAMRYIYPIYPSLAILCALFIYKSYFFILKRKPILNSSIKHLPLFIALSILLVYPFSFMSIYSQDHSRVSASKWIYENVPVGSKISGEHWDDFIPLSLPIPGFIHEKYQGIEYPLYGADSKEKWLFMNEKLKQTDYIILTSNRLYGAIMTVPEKYPQTYRYYRALFDGSLGFNKIAEFTSRPNIPLPFIRLCITPPLAYYGFIAQKSQECRLPGISLVDDYADETFTVYDHPKVLIFKKVVSVDYMKLLGI
mgnify:CR=1 FL=1